MGFSTDIADFPEKYKKRWGEVISKYKCDREFYKNAVARILVDSPQIIIIEYSDVNLDRCILQIYTKITHSRNLVIYPVLEQNKEYLFDGNTISARDALENGIMIDKLNQNSCITLEFIKK